jgi:hypothetical protein
MAIDTTNSALVVQGGHESNASAFCDYVKLVLTGTYATGGYTTFASIISGIVGKGTLTILGIVSQSGAYIFEYDQANDALMMMTTNTTTGVKEEVGNGTNVAATYYVTLLSK